MGTKMDESDLRFIKSEFKGISTQIASLEKDINKLNQSLIDYQVNQRDTIKDIYDKLNPLITKVGELVTIVDNLKEEDSEINKVIKDYPILQKKVDDLLEIKDEEKEDKKDNKKQAISKKQFFIGIGITVSIFLAGILFQIISSLAGG